MSLSFACTRWMRVIETGSFEWMPRGCALLHAAQCSVIAKDNCRQNNVHAEHRSWVIMRSGLEARNKCPCVIDYTLQANEINRAWIDSVGEESSQRGICSRVQWLYWHAHIQRERVKETRLGFWLRTEMCPLPLHGAAFAQHCNQGQCCSNQMLAMGSDTSGTYRLTITAK